MTLLNLFSNGPIYCGEAATTTLSGKAAVKPKNLKNLKNLRGVRPRQLSHTNLSFPVYLYLPFCDTINQL